MARLHLILLFIDVKPHILKYLLVAHHPVSVNDHDQRCHLDFAYEVLDECVIKRWWQLRMPGNKVPFTNPLIHIVKSCQWEEHWHTNPVHHGHEKDIHVFTLFNINEKIRAEPQAPQACY